MTDIEGLMKGLPQRQFSRADRRRLYRESAKMPLSLRQVPQSQWPEWTAAGPPPRRVWRSRFLLVQEFAGEGLVLVRLTVNRTEAGTERWAEGITWDELQRVKRECGYGHVDAVEVFPADKDTVDVDNMRHLWIMAMPLTFAWRSS